MAGSNILWKAPTLQTEFVHLQVSKLIKTATQTNKNKQDI